MRAIKSSLSKSSPPHLPSETNRSESTAQSYTYKTRNYVQNALNTSSWLRMIAELLIYRSHQRENSIFSLSASFDQQAIQAIAAAGSCCIFFFLDASSDVVCFAVTDTFPGSSSNRLPTDAHSVRYWLVSAARLTASDWLLWASFEPCCELIASVSKSSESVSRVNSHPDVWMSLILAISQSRDCNHDDRRTARACSQTPTAHRSQLCSTDSLTGWPGAMVTKQTAESPLNTSLRSLLIARLDSQFLRFVTISSLEN